jgi:hypothetical protein
MVLYEYDGNDILSEPIKNRTAAELSRGFQDMENKLTAKGLQPKLTRLDNKESHLLETYSDEHNINFQLVPPYSYIRNAAERAARSFKHHVIAGLCSTEKSFPMHFWDILLNQAVITLNILRTSRINTKLQASTHIDVQHY